MFWYEPSQEKINKTMPTTPLFIFGGQRNKRKAAENITADSLLYLYTFNCELIFPHNQQMFHIHQWEWHDRI